MKLVISISSGAPVVKVLTGMHHVSGQGVERNATVEVRRVEQVTRDALSNVECPVAAAGALVLGASY